jgi:hypothetical protein
MSYSRIKVWFIVTFTLAVIAVVIRSIWQIVVIPTPGTMLIFIPLITALLGLDALFAYLLFKPGIFRTLPFIIGMTVVLTASLVAGVTHFVRFIISPLAEPFWSQVIGWLVMTSSFSAYLLVVRLIWSFRKQGEG